MIRAGKRVGRLGARWRSHWHARRRISLQPHRPAARRSAMTPDERERLIEEVLARYRTVLRQRLENEPQTLDEIEQAVEDVSQVMDDELAGRLLQRKEQPAVPEENTAACPHCGGRGR